MYFLKRIKGRGYKIVISNYGDWVMSVIHYLEYKNESNDYVTVGTARLDINTNNDDEDVKRKKCTKIIEPLKALGEFYIKEGIQLRSQYR